MVSREGQLLLGMKKRGFGRGLWQHSFCGKLEKGESVAEAAVRELEEESGLQVLPQDLKPQGYFEYEFVDRSHCQVIMCVHIFSCVAWKGQVRECGEIRPAWHSFADVPLHSMWADNSYWLPQVIGGSRVRGYFLYSGLKQIQDSHIEFL